MTGWLRGATLAVLTGSGLWAASGGVAMAAEPTEIRFERGRSAAVVEGAVARGERALFAFVARAGQRASVAVTAPENNAVMQVYPPGSLPEAGAHRPTLPGAEDGADARNWEGNLPASGRYVIAVGAIRGGTEFRLSLAIR
jgi:hypothetical protein